MRRGRGGATRSRRAHSLSGGLFAGALGEDTTLTESPAQSVPPAVDAAILEALNKRTLDIVKRLDDDAKARKYALMIGAASALFAAVKLGLIAFPAIRARVKSTP